MLPLGAGEDQGDTALQAALTGGARVDGTATGIVVNAEW